MSFTTRKAARVSRKRAEWLHKTTSLTVVVALLLTVSPQVNHDGANATWSAVVDISAFPTVFNAPSELATSNDGTKALAVWLADSGNKVVSKTLDGTTWGRESNHGNTGDSVIDPTGAISGDGTVAAVVGRKEKSIGLQWFNPAHSAFLFNSQSTVPTTANSYVFSPKVKISDDGKTFLVVWHESTTATGARDLKAVIGDVSNNALTWGTAFTVSSELGSGASNLFVAPEISLSSDGSKAHIVWIKNKDEAVQLAVLSISNKVATFSVQPTTVTSPALGVGTAVKNPKLAVDDAGVNLVLYYARLTTSWYHVALLASTPSTELVRGATNPEIYLAPDTQVAKVAITPNGNAAVVAYYALGAGFPNGALERRISTTAGAWGGQTYQFFPGDRIVDFSVALGNGGDKVEEAYAWSKRDTTETDKYDLYVARTMESGPSQQPGTPELIVDNSGEAAIRPLTVVSTSGARQIVVWNNFTQMGPRVEAATFVSVAATPEPGPVSNVSATVSGSGSVSLSWPASEGATSYTVTSSPSLPGGASCTVASSGAGTSASCTGLTNGTAYTFSVTATNSGGSSSPVAAAAITPLAVPGSPTNAAATGGTGSAAVTWTAPTNDSTNVPATYTVTASPGGQTCTATHPTVTCSVSGLTARDYTFSVTATNVGGTSAASIATSSVAVTDGSVNNNNGNNTSSAPPAPTINLSNLNGSGSNGSGGALATASAGQTFTLTGTGMNNVNQVNVGDKKAIITLKTATRLGFRLPKNLPAGTYDLSLYGSFGSMTEAKFFSVAKSKIIETVAGFGGNSPVLNAVVNTGINRTIARLGGGVTLVCNGSTSGARVTDAARKLARDRARAACAYAKRANPSVTTKIRISPASSVGAQARNVKLIYRNY